MGLPPPPSVPSFPAGYAPFAADFGNWVTAPLSSCAGGVIFRAQQTTFQAVTAVTWTPLRMTALEDPAGGWDGPDMKWNVPAGYDGWYTVTVGVNVAAGAGLQLQAGLYVSSIPVTMASVPTYSANAGGAFGEAAVFLAGGADWVQPLIWSSANADTDCSTQGRFPFMEIAFEST